ncbi:MAG: hypothetical protein GY737_13040 [Desulfobacteraceae bacterium]|nr:hypothetical protein [Desulfobacteraceae bacterium]
MLIMLSLPCVLAAIIQQNAPSIHETNQPRRQSSPLPLPVWEKNVEEYPRMLDIE